MNKTNTTQIIKYLIITLITIPTIITAKPIALKYALNSQTIPINRPFIFQIQVNGTTRAKLIPFKTNNNITFITQTGSNQSSTQITIINGRRTRIENQQYIINCKLICTKLGSTTIPAMTIVVNGKNYTTQKIPLTIVENPNKNKFILETTTNNKTAYLGEPINIKVTIYILDKLNQLPQFSFPYDQNSDTYQIEIAPIPNPRNHKIYQTTLNNTAINIKLNQQDKYQTKPCISLSFNLIVWAKQTGTLTIPPITAEWNNSQSRSIFDAPFFGGNHRQNDNSVFCISKPISINIKSMPKQNQPINYNGHIGKQLTITAQTKQNNVHIGDPITLNYTIHGSEYPDKLPEIALHKQTNLSKNFKVAKKVDESKTHSNNKTFTLIIRAKNDQINQIPPLELPYFDTKTGTYKIARSNPIPIHVKKTKIITLNDAQGTHIITHNGKEVKGWKQGIAFNYQDLSVLEPMDYNIKNWTKSGTKLTILTTLPTIYLITIIITFIRKKARANPLAKKRRQAYSQFKNHIAQINNQNDTNTQILQIIQQYFSNKFNMPPGAITINDIKQHLTKQKIPQQLITTITNLIQTCEAEKYAGTTTDNNNNQQLISQTKNIIKQMEALIK